MDDELIEKVARAVYECDAPPTILGHSWPNVPAPYKESSIAIARAAIQAVREWDAAHKAPIEPGTTTLSPQETQMAVSSVLNHPTRL